MQNANIETNQQPKGEEALKLYVVYRTTNDITNEQYIGVFSYDETKRKDIYKYQYYIGNGVLHPNQAEKMKTNQFIQNVIKYGYENFTREDLLVTYDKEEAYQLEADLCDEAWVNNPKTLNNRTGGNKNVKVSRVTRDRQSKAQISNSYKARKCVDSTTGVEYSSINQCAIALKIPSSTLQWQLNKYKEEHFIKLI